MAPLISAGGSPGNCQLTCLVVEVSLNSVVTMTLVELYPATRFLCRALLQKAFEKVSGRLFRAVHASVSA